MPLDLSSLQKAVASLERSLRVASHSIEGAVDTDEEQVIRAGVIQNFEFTYEVCLIHDVEPWFEYQAPRNKTAHTYGEKTALRSSRIRFARGFGSQKVFRFGHCRDWKAKGAV